MPKQKKPRGRPPKYPMPEPLDVDMDTLAEVVLRAKPKPESTEGQEWTA